MSEQTPSGWYPDPEDASQQRYWDGAAWTEHRAPAAHPQQPQIAPGPQVPNHPQATTSLVLGIASLLCCGLLTGIPAMILGRKVTKEVDESNGTLQGRGAGAAGFWCGLIGSVLTTLALLAIVAVYAFGVAFFGMFEDACEQAARDDPDLDVSDCRVFGAPSLS